MSRRIRIATSFRRCLAQRPALLREFAESLRRSRRGISDCIERKLHGNASGVWRTCSVPLRSSRWSFAWAAHHLTWRHKDRATSRRPIPQVRVIRCGASSKPATSYTSTLPLTPGTTIELTPSMSPLPNEFWIALTVVNSPHLLARTVPARRVLSRIHSRCVQHPVHLLVHTSGPLEIQRV